MLKIFLKGLLLPFRIYFQPTAFADEIASYAPELPRNYSLWQARQKLKEPEFEQKITTIYLQACIALLWILPALLILSAFGIEINWVGAGVGVGVGVALGAWLSVGLGVATGLALGVAFSAMGGAGLSVTGGVAFGAAFTVAAGVAGGVSFGVAGGVGLGVALGMALGAAGGVMFGVLYGVAAGVAYGVSSALTITHLPFLIFHLLIIWTGLAGFRLSPRLSEKLWYISAVRWDEVIVLPLIGLETYLVKLYRHNQVLGRQAIVETTAHKFQNKIAIKALIRIVWEESSQVTTLPALAAFGRSIEWVVDKEKLPSPYDRILPKMRDISRDAEAVQESDSAAQKVRLLETALNDVGNLANNPSDFNKALRKWERIISEALEKAREEQKNLEPIPQVYIKGDPIRIEGRSNDDLTFKGRQSIFRQLEDGLGNPNNRTTFVLYGERRTGKTSLLFQLPLKLGSRFIPAFVDAQSGEIGGAQNSAAMLTGLVGKIREEALLRRAVRLPEIDSRQINENPYSAIEKWFERVAGVLENRVLLVCLDEFEKLEEGFRKERFDPQILNTLRHIVQHRKQVTFLFSGVSRIQELSPYWASALINTTVLEIGFLDENDARELIASPIKDFPEIYRPAAVNRIISLTHCQPYLIQLMCSLLVERMNAKRRMPPTSWVEVEDVEAVVPLALKQGENYFTDHWQSQIGGDLARNVLRKIAVAERFRLNLEDIQKNISDESALRETLNNLVRRKILEVDNGSIQITVPLVAEFVKRENVF